MGSSMKTLESLLAAVGTMTGRTLQLEPESGAFSKESDPELRDVLTHARALADECTALEAESDLLATELNQAYENLYLYSQIASQISSLHFSKTMLSELLQGTREAMRVELVTARFLDIPGDSVRVSTPAVEELLPDSDAFIETLVAAMPEHAPPFETGCFILNDSKAIPHFAAMHAEPFRALLIAISNAEHQYGWLLLMSFDMKEIFRRGEYRLLGTMTEQLALVMANTDLYRDLEHFVVNLVKSMVMAIEAKDKYTRGHSDRVSKLSLQLAREMGLKTEALNTLQWAAILHDLGKIGTPGTILNKNGRLSDDEFSAIQEHPVKGAEILKPIPQLADALPIIRHHHEHYNGKGYPDGLAGEDIPLLARVISVVDTYDAITSDRAYRAAQPHDKAMAIIADVAGTQLDPGVVSAFQEMVAQYAGEKAGTSAATLIKMLAEDRRNDAEDIAHGNQQ
jgi:putative nucleotidyltransferase with HDIG domain